MLTRILTATVALGILIPVLYFSEYIVFPIVVAVLAVIAVWELFGCMKLRKCIGLFVPALLIGAGLPIAARLNPGLVTPSAVVFLCVALSVAVFGYREFQVNEIGFACFETLIAVLGLTLMVVVRDREPVRYLLIFVAAWVTDTFAYFTGRLCGKHKLCPHISPKKTVEGAIGGVVGCIVGFIVFGLVCNLCLDKQYSLLLLGVIAVPLSVIGQVGDLAASAVKRHYGIKDYGTLFPGHGGVLDRFDSILPISLLAFVLTELEAVL